MAQYFRKGFIFSTFFILGFFMVYKTHPDYISGRSPAAIQRNYDFSLLKGTDLIYAIKARIGNGLQIEKTADSRNISIGHFRFKDPHGNQKYACEEYPKVNLKFFADGEATSGQPIVMEVEGDCKFNSNSSQIDPLWLPVARILNERPADGVYEYTDERSTTVRFSNIDSRWPKTWVLQEISLMHSNGEVGVILDAQEIRQLRKQGFAIQF